MVDDICMHNPNSKNRIRQRHEIIERCSGFRSCIAFEADSASSHLEKSCDGDKDSDETDGEGGKDGDDDVVDDDDKDS